MNNQQKHESKQTSFSSSEVHNGQHGLDCEECAKYFEDYMSESDNEPDSFELESDELDAEFEDFEADQMIEERIENELKMNNEKSVGTDVTSTTEVSAFEHAYKKIAGKLKSGEVTSATAIRLIKLL